ncbi:MAG: hypothetical protein JWM82_3729 [Myxococcales bacterium]|nr:hypothetical protein [Myxococcales bacterium]
MTKRAAAPVYGLVMSKALEGKLGRCRASIRAAIRDQLKDIAAAASGLAKAVTPKSPKEPPHRFYVYDGYRVFYQVDAGTRRVVVLDVGRVNP